jgi:hypothetical protein
MAVDHKGRNVVVGTHVRVIHIADSLREKLSPEEWRDLLSMKGEVFEVYEVNEHGLAWVQKSWDDHRSHSLGLEAHEMEAV